MTRIPNMRRALMGAICGAAILAGAAQAQAQAPQWNIQAVTQPSPAMWLGLSGPRGLSATIVERLTALVPGILARPDLMARFQDVQTLPREPTLIGDAFVALIREQFEHWRAVARAANIEVT